MSYWQGIIIALRALRVNLLRSLLTMLGIIIGVAAVIAMVAVGNGARAQIAERIQNLGASLLVVVPGSQSTGGVHRGAGTRHTLTGRDARAIEQEVSVVTHAAPKVHGRAQVVQGNHNWSTPVSGVTGSFFSALDWNVTRGGVFTREEEAQAAKVALIGTTVAEKLFGKTDSLGKTLRIKNVPFVVVGLLESKGQNLGGQDMDDNVYVPLSTARLRVLGGKHRIAREAVDAVVVKVDGIDQMAEAAAQIGDLLRQRHRLPPDLANDFRIVDITSVQAAHKSAAKTMSLLLLAVASVSLLVGGISIMNIMLVSVTERRREIGLRLAVGARRRDVRNQFLVEALTLSLFGGLIGMFVGIATAVAMAELGGWPIVIGLEPIIFAVGFASAVGVFFGFYPAHKASLLNPIEALRLE